MKATDLMIGDKVMVKVLSQIPNTYVLHTWTANDYSRDIQVKPIPLTPEILEKNGWKDRENLMELRVNEDTYFLWSKGYGVFTGAFINQTDCYICDFKYVHTLQHLLRSYGLSYGLNELNELADNFKI